MPVGTLWGVVGVSLVRDRWVFVVDGIRCFVRYEKYFCEFRCLFEKNIRRLGIGISFVRKELFEKDRRRLSCNRVEESLVREQ